MSEYIAKASIEPRDYRVVFLIQKSGQRIPSGICPQLVLICDFPYRKWLSRPDRYEFR